MVFSAAGLDDCRFDVCWVSTLSVYEDGKLINRSCRARMHTHAHAHGRAAVGSLSVTVEVTHRAAAPTFSQARHRGPVSGFTRCSERMASAPPGGQTGSLHHILPAQSWNFRSHFQLVRHYFHCATFHNKYCTSDFIPYVRYFKVTFFKL